MSNNVQFDEDEITRPRRAVTGNSTKNTPQFMQSSRSGGMTAWLVRHGLITSESSAKFILLSVVFINFLAAGLIIYFFVLKT